LAPQVPRGFRIEAAVQNLHHPTRLVFGPDGRLFVAQQTGEVVAVTLKDGQEAARDQVADAKLTLLGIALKGDKLWVSDTGAIAVYSRTPEGRYANRQEIVMGIPHGLHQNDGFAWGPDGMLYWGVGSTTDRGPEEHPWSGSVMRMNPDGTGVEVYARGFRNPYGIGFGPDGKLWVTDNGVDSQATSDELNLVVQGGDYGFPKVFEMPPAGSPTKAPVALFGEHNSTNGLAVYTGKQFPEQYRGGIFVAEWGSSFDETTGRAVGFVTPDGKVSQLATGLTRPLDVTMGPEGDLWVADFVPGVVWRISYTGEATPAPGTPAPGTPAPGTPAPGTPAPGTPTPGAPAPWLGAALMLGAILLGALAAIWAAKARGKGKNPR
jgi:glucose/arabinose dehydrogenase